MKGLLSATNFSGTRMIACAIATTYLALSSPVMAAEPSCRENPRLVENCLWVRGHLSVRANMRPYLHPAGTRRLLGIASPDGEVIMPAGLTQIFQTRVESELSGDFEVCPFTRRRSGFMQLVCIAAARHLSVSQSRK